MKNLKKIYALGKKTLGLIGPAAVSFAFTGAAVIIAER